VNAPVHPDFVDARQMLAVPRLDTRTEAQAAGADCVWCEAAAPVDLGPRLSVFQGALHRWNPRACRPCARREAGRVYELHIRACARCTPLVCCEDARALHALSQSASVTSRKGPVTG
jgi:hypothetical protein